MIYDYPKVPVKPPLCIWAPEGRHNIDWGRTGVVAPVSTPPPFSCKTYGALRGPTVPCI